MLKTIARLKEIIKGNCDFLKLRKKEKKMKLRLKAVKNQLSRLRQSQKWLML